jgi:3-oxoacyl-[acyl-carrier protein] reductase
MDLGLANRACILTGASGGVGRATALMLAAEQASVLLIGRREQPLTELADACRERGGTAAPLGLDITAPGAADAAISACVTAFGRIDALINNAGASAAKSVDELTDEDWQAQWELHVIAPMRLMRAAAPKLADGGWGRIVNVCSSSGKRPSATNMAYSVTKAAQLSLSRAFADLYAAKGVLVNAVAPGPIAGELWDGPGGLADQLAAKRGTTRETVLEQTAARIPLQRLARSEEVAAVIVFLCSERASNVTGAAWSVDGGTVPVII